MDKEKSMNENLSEEACLNKVEASNKDLSLEDLAEELIIARRLKEKTKEKYDQASQGEKKIQTLLLEQMDSSDISSFTHKELGKFTAAQRIWTRIKEQEKAIKFFDEIGLTNEVFKLQPVVGRLSAFVKEKLQNGESIPEFLDISPTRYISVRRR